MKKGNIEILKQLKNKLLETRLAYFKAEYNLYFGLSKKLIIDKSSFEKQIMDKRESYEKVCEEFSIYFENCLRSYIINGKESFKFLTFT